MFVNWWPNYDDHLEDMIFVLQTHYIANLAQWGKLCAVRFVDLYYRTQMEEHYIIFKRNMPMWFIIVQECL